MTNQNEKKAIIDKIKASDAPDEQKKKLISMVDKLEPDELKMVMEMQSRTPEEVQELAKQQVEQAKAMHEEIKAAKEKTIRESQAMITKRITEVREEDEAKETEKEITRLREELK